MNIIYFSNSTLPSKEANAVHVVQMAEAFTESGHDVTLWGHKGSLDNVENIYESYNISKKVVIKFYEKFSFKGSSTLASINAIWFAYRRKTDLIIGRDAKICALASLFGFKVIFETHQPVSFFPFFERLLLILAIRFKRFKKIITISKFLQDVLCNENHIRKDYVQVLNDGAIEAKNIKPLKFDSKNKIHIGYFGHLHRGRGIDIIVELAKLLPEIDFHLVGGNDKDVAFWKKSTNKQNNIFFHGFFNYRQASQYRLSCDILLSPYQENTSVANGMITSQWMSPLKIFEYMASRKPFICSKLPVFDDILFHKKNCFLVESKDVLQWVMAIKTLCNDKNLSIKIAGEAYKNFQEKYTWKKRAQKIIAFM